MSDDFNETMSNPDKFNDCTCDAWPDGSPHRHIGALVDPPEDGIYVAPTLKPGLI